MSVEEVGLLPEAAPGPKYKAALGTAYGTSLRVSEVAALKIDDIDSTRMLIRVEQGKRRKDRNAMLSPQLLALLRLWWRKGKRRNVLLPHGWLFPGRNCLEPISARQLNRGVHDAAEAAGIKKRVTLHTVRRQHSRDKFRGLRNGGFLAHRNRQGVQMRQKSGPAKLSSEQIMKDIRRATRKQYSAEEKIRIVLDGLRGEHSIAAPRSKTAILLTAQSSPEVHHHSDGQLL